ncbi:MAG: sugar ABC transporter permease [Rectinemataceae bacterium]|jgi:raffinose/stachyose/melibiose transport system permease protein
MRKAKHPAIFWLFLAPVLFAFVMVIAVPFILGVFYSFTSWSATARIGDSLRFIGLGNYSKILKDPSFAYSFMLTVAYTLLNMIAINVVSFGLAMLVTRSIKGRNVYRAGFFVPNLIGGLILGYVWQFIFNNALPSIGTLLGLASWANPDNLILAKSATALVALVIVGTWQYAGYIMVIYVAAIENIPQELIEAAQIDGASPFRRLLSITLPMTGQAFTITLFLTLVNSFKQFDVNVSLTAGGPAVMFMGKPIYGTELLAMNIYNQGFKSNDMAGGQARAVVFFLVLAIVAIIQVSINKKREIEL